LFFKVSLNKKNKIKFLSRLFFLNNDYNLMRIPIYHTFFNTFGLVIFPYNMSVHDTNDDEMSPTYRWGKKC